MTEHVHTWRLPPPNGPVALASCACGSTQRRYNSWLGDYTPDEIARLLQRPRERKSVGMVVTPRQR